MDINESLICPHCNATQFKIKREATYLYTYNLDTSNTDKGSSEDDLLPFLFDYREQLGSKEYLECNECGAQYPCRLDKGEPRVQFTILQKAIRSEFEKNPHYLG